MLSSKKIFFGASGVFLFLFLLLPISFFINLKYAEKVLAQEGYNSTSCYLINKGFNMIVGGYSLPVFTENTKNKFFSGFPVYRYFFPSCPALNKSDRPKLYDFDKSGALTLADNLVIGGNKTFLLTNDAVAIGKYQSDNIGGDWTFLSTYLTFIKDIMTVALNSSAILPESWNVLDTSYRGFRGPSAYLDNKSSVLRFDYEQAIYNDRENKVVELEFSNMPSPVVEYAYMGLEDPTDFEYKNNYFYITDQKKNQVIKYAMVTSTSETLGNPDWGWNPEGIAIDSDEILYITDSDKDRIVKTKINGEDWEVSYDDNYYDYYTRFSLTGEEHFYFTPSSTNSNIAEKVTFQESGLGNYWMEIKKDGENIYYNQNTKKLGNNEIHLDEIEKVFGDHSLSFNGNSYLMLPQKDGLKFKNDNFLIDFWINFDTVSKNQIIVSQPDCFMVKYDHDNGLLLFKLALDSYNETSKVDDIEVTTHWNPQRGDWHHVSILRSGINLLPKKIKLFIDGSELASSVESNNVVYEGKSDIYIGGGYYDPFYIKDEVEDYFYGNLDEFRIVKGFNSSATDDPKFLEPYFFNNPKGIIVRGNYLYIADTGNNRIVKMNKDFSDWDTFGILGSGSYQFNQPMDIEYDPISSQFYISDKGNGRVITTDMAILSNKLINENFSPSSWGQVLNFDADNYGDQVPMVYSEQFDEGAEGIFNGQMRFYNRGPNNIALALLGYEMTTALSDDKYMALNMDNDLYLPSNHCGAHPADRCCASAEVFPAVAFNLTPFMQSRLYSDRVITVRMKVQYKDNLNVSLTRRPGATRIDNEDSRDFNITKTVSSGDDTVWSDETISFYLPPRVSINDPDNIYLTFNTCGRLNFNFLEVEINRKVDLGGITVDNGNFYVTDTYNGYVFTDAFGGGVFGGKNPPENDIEGDTAHKIRFIYPLEIEPAGGGRFYVLDGVSDKDMVVEAGGQKMTHFYGTKQTDDYYVDIKEGGLWFKDTLSVQGINDKFQVYKDMDTGAIELPKTHKVWVSYGLGPALSHCKIIDNSSETFDLSSLVDNDYDYCGFSHSFKTNNDGGYRCHHDISINTNPRFVELDGFYYNPSNLITIDCKQIAEDRSPIGVGSPYPVPPSECIPGPTGDGLWDWYNEYPYCTHWSPEFKRERICVDWWPQCYPIGVGQAGCTSASVSCNNGSYSVGTCNRGSADDGDCSGDTGSCLTSGICSANVVNLGGAGNSRDCVPVPNLTTCNPEGATIDLYQCKYTNSCSVATSSCWDSTASPPGPASCSSAHCPNDWYFVEANDCCKEWSWNCSAHCLPSQSNCFEGYAVRTRQDWKTAIITVEKADLNPGTVAIPNPNYCTPVPDTETSFMIDFFDERRPPPFDMEMLIKDSYNDDNMFRLGLIDIDEDGEFECHHRYLSDYKSNIMDAGKLLGGTRGYETFEDYLNSLDGPDVVITKVELFLTE